MKGAREVLLGSTRLPVLVAGLRASVRGDLGVAAFLPTARKFCLVGDRVGSAVFGCLLVVVGAVGAGFLPLPCFLFFGFTVGRNGSELTASWICCFSSAWIRPLFGFFILLALPFLNFGLSCFSLV